jgi:hypothetical protein
MACIQRTRFSSRSICFSLSIVESQNRAQIEVPSNTHTYIHPIWANVAKPKFINSLLKTSKYIVTYLGTETRFGLVTQFIGYLYHNYTQNPHFKHVLCTLILHFLLLSFTSELLVLMLLGSVLDLLRSLPICLFSSQLPR